MSRYVGPRLKKMRALGLNLPGLSRKSIDRRPYPPGEHGQDRRRKVSDYGRQLREKQKIRLHYGLREKQLQTMMKESKRGKMATGAKLVELLERRLDNVLFRAGFGPTIPATRQLCNHGHFMVNGRRVDIASYRVRQGDIIQVRQKSANMALILESLEDYAPYRPDWLEVDPSTRSAKVVTLPTEDTIPFPVDPEARGRHGSAYVAQAPERK